MANMCTQITHSKYASCSNAEQFWTAKGRTHILSSWHSHGLALKWVVPSVGKYALFPNIYLEKYIYSKIIYIYMCIYAYIHIYMYMPSCNMTFTYIWISIYIYMERKKLLADTCSLNIKKLIIIRLT